MFTPQQIDQISFSRATFGGYDMQSVDEFLEPLTEDYVTLYKENALLKSKMKLLVGKLEEYRAGEASMKEAMVETQNTCEKMIKEAEEKCAQMIVDATAAAAENAKNADALVEAENARVEQARQAAHLKIEELQSQLNACVQTLERIKEANLPLHKPAENAEDSAASADAVADEISANLVALMGTAEDVAPKAEPRHPVTDTTTKFANLQFGRNYDPNAK